ncbi:MAG: Wzz/FepE/Etk N-terminal domain-containing protein [Patescibacteria group bacterium]|nr:Wzz/FepE/Etk N-terminal domain-containing protein [Patescibacteria group bacterium]
MGNPPIYFAPPEYDDDLSLVGLWQVLMRQWKTILSFMVVSVAATAGYLSFATPTYEANAVVLPPERHHVEALNLPGINTITPEEVYKVFTRNLMSDSLRRQFFDEHKLFSVLGGGPADTEEAVFQRKFSDKLQTKEGTREQKDRLFVTLGGTHREHVAPWLNEYLAFAAGQTVQDIVEGVVSRVTGERDNLQKQIDISRRLAKQLREDRIASLEERLAILRDGGRRQDRLVLLDEQIAIARELGIINRGDAPKWTSDGTGLAVSVATISEPLYLRGATELMAEKEAIANRESDDPFQAGVRELTAEIEVLKARKEDDPFISGLRPKEEQLAQMDAGLTLFQSAISSVIAARIDRPAITPDSPASPKKSRILPLGLVAGLFLGVFAAFQVNAFSQQKEKEQG